MRAQLGEIGTEDAGRDPLHSAADAQQAAVHLGGDQQHEDAGAALAGIQQDGTGALPGQGTLAQGDDEGTQAADSAGFRGGNIAAPDAAQHYDDQEHNGQCTQGGLQLALGIRVLIERLAGHRIQADGSGMSGAIDRCIDDEDGGHQDTRQNTANEQLADGHLCHSTVNDKEQAGWDDHAQIG